MDTVNLLANNSDTFVFSRILTPWADAYPLADGAFRGHMRRSASSHVVNHEWSTAKENVTFDATNAIGTVAFSTNPANGKILTLGGTTVTFVTSGATGNQVNIGGSLAATLASLLALSQGSADANLAKCTYALNGSTLSATYKTAALAGNAFVLATDVAGATASGATLTGAGGLLTLTVDRADLPRFSGDYVYSLQFEHDDLVVSLFGGTITFAQDVTR
jgi:hypothetical protein